ncbi:unnamed protein product [Arctogadus glacialis]
MQICRQCDDTKKPLLSVSSDSKWRGGLQKRVGPLPQLLPPDQRRGSVSWGGPHRPSSQPPEGGSPHGRTVPQGPSGAVPGGQVSSRAALLSALLSNQDKNNEVKFCSFIKRTHLEGGFGALYDPPPPQTWRVSPPGGGAPSRGGGYAASSVLITHRPRGSRDSRGEAPSHRAP